MSRRCTEPEPVQGGDLREHQPRHAARSTARQIEPALAVNTTTSAHLDAAKTALRQYMRAGGGFVGIHNAFGTEYNWPYYEGLLGNANYYDHGANQNGTVGRRCQDSSTAGLPAALGLQRRVVQPAAVPDASEVPADRRRELARHAARDRIPGHGKFHPVAWCQYYDGGRVVGHHARARRPGLHGWLGLPRAGAVPEPDHNGILSAMGLLPFCN